MKIRCARQNCKGPGAVHADRGFEQGREERIRSYEKAREELQPLLKAENGSTAPCFYAIGNAHLDLAWLWPMAETYRKTGTDLRGTAQAAGGISGI